LRVSDFYLYLPDPDYVFTSGFPSILRAGQSYPYIMASAASCFIGILEVRAKINIDDIAEIESELMPAAKYISDNQEEFGVDIDIEGDLRLIVENIQMTLTKSSASRRS
jgi:hypothetical protein